MRLPSIDVPRNVHRDIPTSPCSECGSALPRIQMNGALLVVPAGSLDTAIDTQPDAHIFVASSANWDRGLEDVPRIDDLPG